MTQSPLAGHLFVNIGAGFIVAIPGLFPDDPRYQWDEIKRTFMPALKKEDRLYEKTIHIDAGH